MHRLRITLISVVLAAIILPLLSLFIPMPAGYPLGPQGYYETLIGTFMFSVLYAGAAIIYLEGLKTFKPQLRHAYRIICVGIAFIGLNSLQYPIFGVFNLWYSQWFLQGGADIPYFAASILIFIGVGRFAHVLSLTPKALSIPLMTILTLLVGVVVFVMTRLLHLEQSTFDMHLTLTSMPIVPFLLTMLGALKIKQSTGPAYANALAWLVITLLGSAVGVALLASFDFVDQTRVLALLLLPIVLGTLWIKSAYTFNKISLY
jgi:hypothetical protein